MSLEGDVYNETKRKKKKRRDEKRGKEQGSKQGEDAVKSRTESGYGKSIYNWESFFYKLNRMVWKLTKKWQKMVTMTKKGKEKDLKPLQNTKARGTT